MGAVNISNTGSGAAVTLSSDGTDLLLDGTAIGGGGGGASAITISNKTAAYTVVAGDLGTIINCTANSFTVTLTSAATLGSGFNCWVWNTGTGSINVTPSGAETIDSRTTLLLYRGEGMQIVSNGTNWETGDKKTMRGYAENYPANDTRPVASATRSTAIGVNGAGAGSQAVTGAGAMALGGSYASGADSFAAAVANNSSLYGSKGANSIALGRRANASASNATAFGEDVKATGSYAIAFGWGAESLAYNSVAIGAFAKSTQNYGYAFGNGALSESVGKYAFTGAFFSSYGDAQYGNIVLYRATTNATATVLASNSSAASSTNQVILPNNSAYAFTGTVVARQQASGGTASAAWKVEGLIRREANAASTTLVASTVTAIDNTPGWTLALSADTTNGGLKVEATGAAATNIRWVATIQTSEVTYA